MVNNSRGYRKNPSNNSSKQGQSYVRVQGQLELANGNNSNINSRESAEREQKRLNGDKIDERFGFSRYRDSNSDGQESRIGWLLNYLPTTIPDESGNELSGIDLYMIDYKGGEFKCTVFYRPYFYVDVKDSRRLMELTNHLQRRFEGCHVEQISKEDLDMPNHLSGNQHVFLKLSFPNVNALMEAKQQLRPIILQNQKAGENEEFMNDEDIDAEFNSGVRNQSTRDSISFICDMREYDVPYAMRVCIDLDLRVGSWHKVTPIASTIGCDILREKDRLELCQPDILAFDIECEKAPLKFPDASRDRIYMISYMFNGQGFLIINREVVSADVEDFEYTPKPRFKGEFKIFNEADEKALLKKFISHIQELRPHITVTYNGDGFDWPYVEKRCNYEGISLYKELGIRAVKGSSQEFEYVGRCIVHLDAFSWVRRDSYLPQGSQGLKAVTRAKLGYDPIEIDAEDMLPMAQNDPNTMAAYSVSDAVATYYLYFTYVHNFIFSLSTIIPMGPEDVLRKGSGTLCEALLMVEAYHVNIICPNKQIEQNLAFHDNSGHLLESETYIGGHVECLEAGVFRDDIPNKFEMNRDAFQELIDNIDRDLTFALEVEHGMERADMSNYDHVRQQIVEQLEMLRDNPARTENPRIYHLDVGAMYPNIILTNRLQPSALVSLSDCAACDYNREANECKRHMTWTWRGEVSPAERAEFSSVRRQLVYERHVNPYTGEECTFEDLNDADQAKLIKQRLRMYSQRVYKRQKDTVIEQRVDTICMRENPFYVDTVRAFRDRRYDYKLLTKEWKKKKVNFEKANDFDEMRKAGDREVLYDSLQLAHKCILNSFYGYVMRKGARWRSMQMAGIVTYTGAQLIKQARELVEQIGRPLELDTDGIWCILPQSFPDCYNMISRNGKKVKIEYPCAMLNAEVHANYTNHQYQDQQLGPNGQSTNRYSTHSECSIYFELDGPYKAMILPASPEEGKLLKKKYCVYNFDGSIAEMKGFELKRRGELELVKAFQSEVFERFLDGNSLQSVYDAVGKVANYWLDILDTEGKNVDDDELLNFISERKTISKTVEESGDRKATSLTTAIRLADFLGDSMVKDKGLSFNLILSRFPTNAPVTERALPVSIFSSKPEVRRHFLRKWCKEPTLNVDDFRNLVDWEYYKNRLGNSIQKIVTIPAGSQFVQNPCPRVAHPVWLQRKMDEALSGRRQTRMNNYFTSSANKFMVRPASNAMLTNGTSISAKAAAGEVEMPDMEDIGSPSTGSMRTKVVAHRYKRSSSQIENDDYANTNDDADVDVETDDPIVGDDIDIDDYNMNVNTSPRASISKENDNASTSISPQKSSLPPPMLVKTPENEEERLAWLKERKEGWAKSRKQKQADRVAMARPNAARDNALARLNDKSKKPLSLGDMLTNNALARTYRPWQIIELQETGVPGEFIVWAMTSIDQLQAIKVVIPRTIYVNCRGKSSVKLCHYWKAKKVSKQLPHSRPELELYQVELKEEDMVKNEKTLSCFMAHPQVEGVYETKTPLWLKFVVSHGCNVKVADSSTQEQLSTYNLNDLVHVDVKMHAYLDTKVAHFRRVFIYRIHDRSSSSGRGLIALFTFDGTNVDAAESDVLEVDAFVWFSRGKRTRRVTDSYPNLKRIYQRFNPPSSASASNPNPNLNSKIDVKFKHVSYTADIHSASLACNEKLDAFKKRGPTIATALGALDSRHWRRSIPILNDLPLVLMPSSTSDEMFPALQWQKFASERLIQRFLMFPEWFEDRLQCARAAQAPIANLGADVNMTMSDLLFARMLTRDRHILWASETAVPDLGGAEADQHDVWSDKLVEPIINESGCYRSVCMELDIQFLAIQAIDQANNLDASELTSVAVNKATVTGTDDTQLGNGTAGGSAVTYDTACARAFQTLKAVVASWLSEVRQGDAHADSLLVNFYRYLSGHGNTLLHDPALYRIVFGLMTKLFKRLVNEIRRLGLVVVHANFNRMVVNTGKYDADAAKEHIDFVLGALRQRSLFSILQIRMKLPIWRQLIWLGPENYGGIEVPLDDDINDDNKLEDEVSADEGTEENNASSDIPMDATTTTKIESTVLDRTSENIIVDVGDDVGDDVDDDELKDVSSKDNNAIGHQDQEPTESSSSSASINTKSTVHPFFSNAFNRKSVSNAGTDLDKENATATNIQRSTINESTISNANSTVTELASTNATNSEPLQMEEGSAHDDEEVSSGSGSDDNDNDNDNEEDYDFLDSLNDLDGNNEEDDDNGEDYRSSNYYDEDEDILAGKGSINVRLRNKQRQRERRRKNNQRRLASKDQLNAAGQSIDKDLNQREYDDNNGDYDDDDDEDNNNDNINNQVVETESYAELLLRQYGIHSSWNLASFLPASAEMFFQKIIAEFLILDLALWNKYVEKRQYSIDNIDAYDVDLADAVMSDEDIATKVAEHWKTIITTKLQTEMLNHIAQLSDTFQQESPLVFPKRAGSHLQLTAPALEYTKMVTHILSLDLSLNDEISSLRRALLRELKVREFSEDSDYVDPCLSHILPDVICSYCQACRDIDLLRDISVTSNNIEDRWKCNECHHAYNKDEIELRLIQEVENLSTSYLLQDLRCPKTKRVTARITEAYSSLSIQLELDHSQNNFEKSLSTLHKVAEYHRFELLTEAVEGLYTT